MSIFDLMVDLNTKSGIKVGCYKKFKKEVIQTYKKFFFFKRKRLVDQIEKKWVGVKTVRFYRASSSSGVGDKYKSGYQYAFFVKESNLDNMSLYDLRKFKFRLHISNYLPENDYEVVKIYPENGAGEYEVHFRKVGETEEFFWEK